MTVAFDAVTESDHAAAGASPHDFTHNPVGTPKGIIVTCIGNVDTTSVVTGITYGGDAMTRVVTAVDSASEPGYVDVWFLGTSIPTDDPATVSVTLSDTTNATWINCYSFTASADTEVVDYGKVDENATNPSVTLGTGGRVCTNVVAHFSGLANPGLITEDANHTIGKEKDFGNQSAHTSYLTTPSASVFANSVTAASEDSAFAVVAISEVVSTQLWYNVLESSGDDTNATAYTTGSLNWGDDRVVVVGYLSARTITPPDTPTISGGGLTWVEVSSVQYADQAGTISRCLTVWVAYTGTGASTDNIDFSHGADSQLAGRWTVFEVTGGTWSGDVTDAIVQFDDNFDDTATVTTLATALSAKGDAANGIIHIGSKNSAADTWVEEVGGTLKFVGHGSVVSGEAYSVGSAFSYGTDTSPALTWTGAAKCAAIAFELAAVSGGSVTYTRAATFDATGALDATRTWTAFRVTDLSATGTLEAVGVPTRVRAASFDATATLEATGTREALASASFDATATLDVGDPAAVDTTPPRHTYRPLRGGRSIWYVTKRR